MFRRLAWSAAFLVLTLVTLDAQRPRDLVDTQFTARVMSVIDGDTVDVRLPSGRRMRVRLHGVDTPESGEPLFQGARDFTRVLMFAKDVAMTGKDVDAYGRLVARIVVDGEDASEAIIAAGLGCTHHRYVVDPALDAAWDRARAARLGFWAANARQPACVRREARTRSATTPQSTSTPSANGFIGNVSSRVYHLPTCRNATCRNCTRRFATRADAEAAGFRPAGDCIRR